VVEGRDRRADHGADPEDPLQIKIKPTISIDRIIRPARLSLLWECVWCTWSSHAFSLL
jgi:hypothetical protein